MTLEEVRALEAPGSNLGARGGHLTAGKGYEWGVGGAPWPNEGPRDGAKGGWGGKGEAARAGHGRLTRGRRSFHASGNRVSQVWGKQRPPPVSQSRGRAVQDEGPSRPRRRETGGGGRRPGRLSCPEPGGLCPRHPLPRLRTLLQPPPPGSHIPGTPPRDPASPCRWGPWTTEGLLSRRTQEPSPAPALLRDGHRPPRPP